MKLRVVLVTALILSVSFPAYSQDSGFSVLSGTISGLPVFLAPPP